jgi:hypothetical protein
MEQSIRSRARNQPAVIQVISIGENFARGLQVMSLAGARKLALVRRKQDQLRIDRCDGASDCIGEFCVADGHVIERAVRLHMVRSHIQCGGDRLKNSELISYRVEHFLIRYFEFLASEIFAIKKTRMRADRDSVLFSMGNRGVHGIGIAGVKTGRDVGRSD